MKPHLLLLLAIYLGNLSGVLAQPHSQKITPANGFFVFNTETTLVANLSLVDLTTYAAEHLGCPVHNNHSDNNSIALLLDPSLSVAESYKLVVAPNHIVIYGADRGGIFNGLQTLFRLLPPEVYTRKGISAGVRIACSTITDAPRFSYRGMMLDVARTWVGMDGMKRFINLLGYHNINKLHLHLSDDEGWRIEIKSHPELTTIGGFRGGDSPVRAVYGKWNEKYGGYFTQTEMRELIAYAATRNIEIIPEIDLPGHSRNIASVHPEIRCNYPPDTVSTNGYDYRSAWCVAREENYTLLADILGELCELFPSPYIHIGGDEVDTEQWQRCPDCQALMQRIGINDPRQLEDHFMERVNKILVSHGKYAGVWNEVAATGRFTRNCRVYGWQSISACLDATAKGYRTVVMPGEYCYLDMRQSPHEDGHDWAAIFDIRKICKFDFDKLGFSEEQQSHIEGISGAFWSEAYISHNPENPDYLDYMCFPRLCALSRLGWNGSTGPWEEYGKMLRSEHYDRLTAMGIGFRLFPPEVQYKNGRLSATADRNHTLWYVEEYTTKEHRYSGPIVTNQPHRYRFFTRYKTAHSPYAALPAHYRTIQPAVTITTSMGEDPKFPYTNASTYKGLSRTSRACRQGDWIHYDFAQPVHCRAMFLQTGNRQLPKTIITTGYVEVSFDGRQFVAAGDLDKGSITLRYDRPIRAVRIHSTCNDNGTPYVTIQPPKIKPRL